MARKKKIKLTQAEKRLLLFPPTETTWLCETHTRDDGSNYTMVNSGREKICGLCGKAKPRKPKLLWEEYTALCKTLGIHPGTYWKEVNGTQYVRVKGKSWRPRS